MTSTAQGHIFELGMSFTTDEVLIGEAGPFTPVRGTLSSNRWPGAAAFTAVVSGPEGSVRFDSLDELPEWLKVLVRGTLS
ncbi:MAG: hypothetical protein WKF57_05980 [Nakamurella sp.]